MNEESLKNVVIAYKMFITERSSENMLYLAMSLSEYGLTTDAFDFLLSYLKGGGSQSNLPHIISSFPEEVKKVVFEYTKPTDTKEEFDAQSYLEMADLLWDIGSAEDAKQNYTRAISAFASKGEIEKAQNVLKNVRDKYPDDPEIQNFQFEGQDNRILEELQNLQVNISKDKESELRYYLGREFLREGIKELGIEEINKVRDIGGLYYKEGTKLLIDNAVYEGDYDNAVNMIDEVLSGDERLDYLYNIGLKYQDEGKIEKSMQIFNKIFSISPNYKDVKDRISPPKPKKEEILVKPARVEVTPVKSEQIEHIDKKKFEKPTKIDEENIIFI